MRRSSAAPDLGFTVIRSVGVPHPIFNNVLFGIGIWARTRNRRRMLWRPGGSSPRRADGAVPGAGSAEPPGNPTAEFWSWPCKGPWPCSDDSWFCVCPVQALNAALVGDAGSTARQPVWPARWLASGAAQPGGSVLSNRPARCRRVSPVARTSDTVAAIISRCEPRGALAAGGGHATARDTARSRYFQCLERVHD